MANQRLWEERIAWSAESLTSELFEVQSEAYLQFFAPAAQIVVPNQRIGLLSGRSMLLFACLNHARAWVRAYV
jgi:hypothetical protein